MVLLRQVMDDLPCFGAVSLSVLEGLEPAFKFILSPVIQDHKVSSSWILQATGFEADNYGDTNSQVV